MTPRALAALAPLALLTACGPPWTIISQAVPDPLIGAKNFYIEPIHYDGLMVGEKPEPEYLAGKTPDQKDSWLTDKSETSGRYAASVIKEDTDLQFAVQPAPGVFIVRPIVRHIEPGFYAVVAAMPTQIQMRVQILASDGTPVDEIGIRAAIQADMINAASGTRMRAAGDYLGVVTGEYLRKRVTGAK